MCELFYAEGLAGNAADCACTTLGLFELKMYLKRKKAPLVPLSLGVTVVFALKINLTLSP